MGYWAKHQDGESHWHASPERERCGGAGYMNCYCGGDLCVCGNQGEIECMGCEDCEPAEDDCYADNDYGWCLGCGRMLTEESVGETCEEHARRERESEHHVPEGKIDVGAEG